MATKTNTAKQPAPLTDLVAMAQAAECLKTLAHPHRLRMIEMLLSGRYTVGELAEACGIPSHMASEHLGLMRQCKMLVAERDGRKTFYRIADPGLEGLLAHLRLWFDPKPTNSNTVLRSDA